MSIADTLRDIEADQNYGLENTGKRNTGFRNSGDGNSGRYNTGHYNSGNFNSGDYNSGSCNTGYCNAGHFNATDYVSGIFNPPELVAQRYSFGAPVAPGTNLYVPVWLFCNDLHARFAETSLEEIQDTLGMPNFDYGVFSRLTGITEEMIAERLAELKSGEAGS